MLRFAYHHAFVHFGAVAFTCATLFLTQEKFEYEVPPAPANAPVVPAPQLLNAGQSPAAPQVLGEVIVSEQPIPGIPILNGPVVGEIVQPAVPVVDVNSQPIGEIVQDWQQNVILPPVEQGYPITGFEVPVEQVVGGEMIGQPLPMIGQPIEIWSQPLVEFPAPSSEMIPMVQGMEIATPGIVVQPNEYPQNFIPYMEAPVEMTQGPIIHGSLALPPGAILISEVVEEVQSDSDAASPGPEAKEGDGTLASPSDIVVNESKKPKLADDATEMMTEELAQARKQIESLEAKLAEAKKELATSRERLYAAEKAAKAMRKERSDESRKSTVYADTAIVTEKKLVVAQERMEQLEKEAAKIAQELKAAQRENVELSNLSKEMEKKLAELAESKKQTGRRKNGAMQKQLAEAKAKNAKLEEQLKKVAGESERRAAAKMKEAEAKNRELTLMAKKLADEVQSIADQKAANEAQLKQLANKLAAAEKSKKRSQDDFAKAKKLQHELSGYKAKNIKLQKELEDAANALKQQAVARQKKVEVLEATVARMTKDLEAFAKQKKVQPKKDKGKGKRVGEAQQKLMQLNREAKSGKSDTQSKSKMDEQKQRKAREAQKKAEELRQRKEAERKKMDAKRKAEIEARRKAEMEARKAVEAKRKAELEAQAKKRAYEAKKAAEAKKPAESKKKADAKGKAKQGSKFDAAAQIKKLKESMERQIKRSTTQIRNLHEAKIEKLVKDGEKKDSSAVKAVRKAMEEEIKKNEAKIRARIEERIQRIQKEAIARAKS